MKNQPVGFWFATILLLSVISPTAAPSPVPLLRAHAHNDYNHIHPLRDALDQGFCSVEADIFLVDGKFLVSHDVKKVTPERTLEKLYLDPLREQIRRNGGRVYPNGPEFTLLIDLKADWRVMYPALRSLLTNYADVLTTYDGDTKQTRAIRIVMTGSSTLEMFDGETFRYACLDGTPVLMDSTTSPVLMPWISADWRKFFKWDGTGTMPPEETQALAQLVKQVHSHGRQLRFWGSPDNAVFWKALVAADVDVINTDDLAGLAAFFYNGAKTGTETSSPAKPQ